MQPNRRVTPRYRAKPACHIVYVEGSGGVRDLSLNGVFILDEDPLPAGTLIKFLLCQERNEISLQGTVVRSEPRSGMAIQFTGMSREAARRLKLYIATLGPEIEKPADPQPARSNRR